MLAAHAINFREQFHQEHGAYVITPDGPMVFEDGAVDENSAEGMGRLIPPPDDDFERSKLICRYWEIVAQRTENEFLEFKVYLQGTGRREEHWIPHLTTKEDSKKFLTYLRQQALRARAKFTKAKKAVTNYTPAWLVERDRVDAEQAAERQQFLDEIEAIEL